MNSDPAFRKAVEAFRRGDISLSLQLAQGAAEPTPEWHHLLGLIRCRLGDPARGAEHLQLAAAADPSNVAFKVMLSRALIDSGRSGEVLKLTKPPATPTSAELALWHARAEAAEAIQNPAAAAEAWAVIAEASEPDPAVWIAFGRSLFKLERFAEAEGVYRRAIAAHPDDDAFLLELGLLYERTNQLDRLERLLDEMKDKPATARLSFLRAVWEQRSGDFAAARQHLLNADPEEDPVRWHRLLVKIADKQGDATAAFDAAIAMNRATPGYHQWRVRAAAFRDELRALARGITPDWAQSICKLGPFDEPAPVFLIGIPRSGTTLLDTFLMGHPAVRVIEEKEILRRASSLVGEQVALPRASSAVLEQARTAYFHELNGLLEPGFDGVVIDKNPLNMVLPGFIHALFPGARIIFAQRHPCDVVLSCFMQSFVPNIGMASFLDISDAADLYDAAMSVWKAATDALALNVHTISYEALIEDPEAELRAVVRFLGLEWDDRIMEHRRTASARGAIPNTSYDQVTEPITRSGVGRWRRYERQLEPVLRVLHPWAERLGYPC